MFAQSAHKERIEERVYSDVIMEQRFVPSTRDHEFVPARAVTVLRNRANLSELWLSLRHGAMITAASIPDLPALVTHTHTHTHTAPSSTWGGRPLIPVSHWLPIKQNYRLTDCHHKLLFEFGSWCSHFPLFYVYGNIQPFLSEDLYFCRSDSTQMGITTA